MCTITIDLPESKKEIITSFLEEIPYIKIRNGKKKLISKEKEEIFNSIKNGLCEVKLISEGKIKAMSLEEMYHELENES